MTNSDSIVKFDELKAAVETIFHSSPISEEFWNNGATYFRDWSNSLKRRRIGSGWRAAFNKLEKFFASHATYVPFSILAAKNRKLPYFNFSTLPGTTCPGAGDCLRICYSFRAWRFPSAFARQMQNTILLQIKSAALADALSADKLTGRVVRLFVDGDFPNVEGMRFIFDNLNPGCSAYGYSKSWQTFRDYVSAGYNVPKNYLLNVSPGSIYDADDELRGWINSQPFTRGEFAYVPINANGINMRGFKRYDDRRYHNAVRSAALQILGQRVISCPGICGACGVNGLQHCGNAALSGITIANGSH